MRSKLYDIVDEKFIDNFNFKHKTFMMDIYYEKYLEYCGTKKTKPQSREKFFTNMRRKKLKLVQICCPYCGNMEIVFLEEKIEDINRIKYCANCGKTSASENAQFQLSSIIRMRYVDDLGVKQADQKHPNNNISILAYEIYHHELILLSSILEVLLRSFFETLIHLNYMGKKNDYVANIIRKSTGNDFMHFDKANDHYKKALGINLKEHISADCRLNLIDLVNIRNTLVHNNGMADKKFKETNTYQRVQRFITGNLIFLTPPDIDFYYLQVAEICDAVIDIFEERYSSQKHDLIANFYFNDFK